jgi:hypothetical protein
MNREEFAAVIDRRYRNGMSYEKIQVEVGFDVEPVVGTAAEHAG